LTAAECKAVPILPGDHRKPRDKAKVEAAVLIVQRWWVCRMVAVIPWRHST
jgi:transposase